nr:MULTISPECIES: phage distal tail protein domain-containing protein [unclassified Streptococcus]
MRILKLINSKGEIMDLMDRAHFGYRPDGLGIAFSNTYEDNNANFIPIERKLNQGKLKLQMLFGLQTTDSYERFLEFAQFLNYQPLTLSYTAKGLDTYYRDCQISELTKSEIGEFDVLAEGFTLDFLTPWYRWEEGRKIKNEPLAGTGKIYQNTDLANNEGYYTYDFIYQNNVDKESQFFILENDSLYFAQDSHSPLEITIEAIEGKIENPSWQIQRENKILQNDRYLVTIPRGGKLVVSSDPHKPQTILYAPDGTEINVYQDQDVTTSNFVKAPIGRSILLFHNVMNADVSYRIRKEWVLI